MSIADRVFPIPSVTTERLVMRRFTRSDLDCVREAFYNFHVTEPMFFEGQTDGRLAEKFIDDTERGYEERTTFVWAICDKNTDECMGAVGFNDIDERKLSAEIGYWLGERFWGKGYAKEAVSAMTRYGFEYMKLHRIYAKCGRENIASMKVLLHAGLKVEGLFKDYFMKDGIYSDAVWFGAVSKD